MGFVNAVRDVGGMEIAKHSVSEFDDIDSFLEMPAEVIVNEKNDDSSEDNKKSKQPTKEIRVWLDVEDPQADILKVCGIKKVDIADFWSGSNNDRAKKRRYLYREPVGRAAKWRFSPIYKLGAGSADSIASLIGKDGNWLKDKQSRFYKLYDSTLRAFEETGVFSPGSVDVIMESLSERVSEISGYWSDKRSSYLLIFSPYFDGRFLYPVEVKSYLNYFRSRLAAQTADIHAKDGSEFSVCALCNSHSSNVVNLDQVFAFATFDKKSFLPGNIDSVENKKKVFPLCPQCYKEMSEGRVRIDSVFTDAKSLYGIRIYVVPELLAGTSKFVKASTIARNFVRKGLEREPYISDGIMRMNDEVVLHFVFWEKNQAQERLLLMVEDVPPSRLKRAEEAWMSSAEATGIAKLFKEYNKSYPGSSILYRALGLMWSKVMELAGKSEGEQNYTRDWMLGIEGRILAGEHINVEAVKSFFVSRIQGLCADHDWVQKSSKYFARDIACIVDFLYRLNEKEGSL